MGIEPAALQSQAWRSKQETPLNLGTISLRQWSMGIGCTLKMHSLKTLDAHRDKGTIVTVIDFAVPSAET